MGSGKSTLVSAIIGELVKEKGTVKKKGKLWIVPQQPWIFNATLKGNIIIGQKFNQQHYDNIVRISELVTNCSLLFLLRIGKRS